MRTFSYKIKDSVGIHARPAGMLVKEAKKYNSTITIECNGRSVILTKLMMLMSMGIKCGETVNITVSGDDENVAADEIEKFFIENL